MVMTQDRIDKINEKYGTIPLNKMTTSSLPPQVGVEARLASKIGEAQIAVAKQEEYAQIAEHKAEHIAKIRADVSLQKSLKQYAVIIATDGAVYYKQELFFGNAQGDLGLQIVPETVEMLCSNLNDKETVIRATVKIRNKEASYCVYSKDIGKKKAIDFLESIGVNFHFSLKKEKELKMAFLNEIRKMAVRHVLPDHHGWYRYNGKLGYADGSVETWREVVRNV